MDFLKGYKTNAGLVIGLVSLVIGKEISSDDVMQVITNIGQIVGAVMATYGLVMKIARDLGYVQTQK